MRYSKQCRTMCAESQDISFEMRRLEVVKIYFGPKIALKGSNGTDQRTFANPRAQTWLPGSPILLNMRFIVVDAADARGSVAVFNDAELLFIEAHSSDEDYSSWLLPAVKRALSSCALSLSQLDGYAVCAGRSSRGGRGRPARAGPAGTDV